MFEAALFDLDGTLIDSDEAIVWCVNELLRRHDSPPAEPAAIIKLIGVGLIPLLREFIAEPESYVAEYKQLYRQGFGDKTKMYPGVIETLTALRSKGLRIAIVTNRNRALAADILFHFGLDTFTDEVVGDGEGLPLKPDPAVVFDACRRLGVQPSASLMIGDSIIDIQTGKNAGCETILVVHKDQPAGAGSADHVVTSLNQILDLV